MGAGRGWLRRVASFGTVLALTLGGLGAAALALPQPGTGDADLAGFVTLNGSPEIGAQVCVHDLDGAACELTEPDGSYSFDDLVAGSYELWATPPAGSYGLPVGGGTSTYAATPPIGVTLDTGPNPQNLPLTQGGRISLTAHHPGGALAPGLPVLMCPIGAPGSGSCPQSVSTFTDGLGQATSPALLPGPYRVVVGYAISPAESPKTFPSVVVSAGATTDLGDVTLEVPGSLDGYVRNTSSQPIPGATVTISAPGSSFGTSTDATGYYSFATVAPDTYSVSASIFGLPYGTATESGVVVEENLPTTQDLVLPSVSFTGITGTSTGTVAASYTYDAVVACPNGGHTTVGLTCPGAAFALTNAFGAFALALTPGVSYNVAPAFTSTPGVVQLVGEEVLGVTVSAGQTSLCTFVTGDVTTSECVNLPPPPAGTLVLTVDEPAGMLYHPGFCADPGLPQLGQLNCTDGQPATIFFSTPAGDTRTVTLSPGLYHSGMANQTVTLGAPIVPFRIYDGLTTECSFKMSGATCTVNDGQGVDEPAGYDGNGDGVDDVLQPNVTSLLPEVGTELVTIAADAPVGPTLSNVAAGPVPADKPAGAEFPVGVLSFDVVLPAGETTATVDIHLPPGTNPTGYFKLLGGEWVALPSSGPGTYATISGDVVTLNLVDGDPFDTNPAAGVIGDPGAAGVGYQFSGFLPPIGKSAAVKAGSTVPVRWRILDAEGAPVSDPDSVVGVTSTPCGGDSATPVETNGRSGLKYLGDGMWSVNWKTAKSMAGQCRTLTLQLNDGFGGRTADIQFK